MLSVLLGLRRPRNLVRLQTVLWGPRPCTSKKQPATTHASGPQTTLRPRLGAGHLTMSCKMPMATAFPGALLEELGKHSFLRDGDRRVTEAAAQAGRENRLKCGS